MNASSIKRLFVAVSFLTFTAITTYSQNITISGYISDNETGEKLIGANIFESNAGRGATSNNYGFYSLTVPKSDSIFINISYIGYVSISDTIDVKSGLSKNYSLIPGTILAEVIVNANKGQITDKASEMSVISIPLSQIENLPSIGGESDIMKALQLMPGVSSGNEASSGIYVRGGTPDQNLILLDDVPLYYVNHLGGFVSTFNSDALSGIKLVKGGFPAIYGSRLSSVLDIRMKEGNMREFKGSGMIGMVASKVSIEGPIIKDTASYIVSFRRFMYDIFMLPLSEALTQGLAIGYNFYDFNAKVNYRFSDKDRLFLSVYLGDDRISFRRKDNSYYSSSKIKINQDWGNNLFALRWNHIYGPKLFSNSILSYTRYRLLNDMSKNIDDGSYVQSAYSSFISGINDISAKIDFEYFALPAIKMKFGINSLYHTFTPGLASYNQNDNQGFDVDTTFGNYKLNAFEHAAYLSNEINLGGKLFGDIGGRFSLYQVNGKNYFSLEPRVLLSVPIGSYVILKSSYATMQQNVHLLTNSGVGIPTDLWLPATEKVNPAKSTQYAFGVSGLLFNSKYEISLEGYYKDMSNLIAYKEGASTVNATSDWQDKVETDGKGKSYGLEFLFQKKAGRTTGWVGYTLSRTTRQFSNINNGEPFNYKYDRTHDISIVFSHQINENIDISATWVYGTGNAFTMAVGRYDVINDASSWHNENGDDFTYNSQAYIYNGINNFRMRAYHRLDIGANFHKKTKWGERTWNVSIYNLYNRKNPYYYFFDQVGSQMVLKQQSLFPIIPSVSYSFKF